jgi:CRISPR-associated protein Cmr4
MNTKILSLFARTPVHVGAGNSVGAVDSPVMRERHTRIPIIPGSSLKGVLADLWFDDDNLEKLSKGDKTIWRRKKDSDVAILFGSDDDQAAAAGTLLIGEARVLAFPVRSAKGGFAWITCPLALARFKRDAGAEFEVPKVADETCLASSDICLDGKVILEEYCLSATGKCDVWTELKNLTNDAVWGDLGKRFAVVSDEMFSYFVEQACEVVTRVRIDDETGVVANGALFNQENVPSETMFYAVIAAQPRRGTTSADGSLQKLAAKLDDIGKIIQVGGDETIGLGYCSATLMGGE